MLESLIDKALTNLPFVIGYTAVASLAIMMIMVAFSSGRLDFKKSAIMSLATSGVFALVTIVAGTAYFNITQPQRIEAARAQSAYVNIEANATLGAGKDDPWMDLSAGENNYKDQQMKSDLITGKTIQLKTGSGKKADMRLVYTEAGQVTSVVTYDGKPLKSYMDAFNDLKPKAYPLTPLFAKPASLPKA